MNGITLWLFGGVSGLGEAPSPAVEARIAERWRGVRAGQIMTPGPATMPGSMTVTEFLADYFYRTRHQGFPVMRDDQGTVPGLVTLDRIKQVPACERDHTRLADIACPLTEVARAAPGDSVAGILPRSPRAPAGDDGKLITAVNNALAGDVTLPDSLGRGSQEIATSL